MANSTQQKAQQNLYLQRKATLDQNLPEIHTYVIKIINQYIVDRREDCVKYIGDYEKEIN